MAKRPWIVLGVMFLLCIALRAQEAGSVRGVVLDQDFDAPLAGAQVSILETNQQVTTSDLGDYVFREVSPGTYTLVFSKPGYIRRVRSGIVVSAGRLTEVDESLSGDFTDMDEFVVQDVLQLGGESESALLQLRFDSPSLLDSISADLMSQAGVSDAAGALRLVAGASVKDGKSAVIRGLPDRYVSTQMNGVRLPTADEDKRAVELDQFPTAVIESIQVSKTFTPDQQGDASGGAVDVRLKGVPDEPWFIKIKGQSSHNTNVTGRSRFLTYDGGGIHDSGRDDGGREIQGRNVGESWEGAVGVSRSEAPVDYKWNLSAGGHHELESGIKVGGFASLFYERDSSFYDGGIDDALWVEAPGRPLTPQSSQGAVQTGDPKTSLFDVTKGSQMLQWGGLATLGVETENHKLNLAYMYSRTTEDTATLAEDTRGKAFFFPGYDPDDQTTPGHDDPDAAPYKRFETLEFTERRTTTLQWSGWHRLPVEDHYDGVIRSPELDWTLARSSAHMFQPDKRQFASVWVPGRVVGPVEIAATHSIFQPSATFSLGNLQRIWKTIDEDGVHKSINLKLPFEQWTGDEGYFKLGWYRDRLTRNFNQDTFSNFGDQAKFEGEFDVFWSAAFPTEEHPVTASDFDVDYSADQVLRAWYAMVDIPVFTGLNIITGARLESTQIGIVNTAESSATWFPPGSVTQTDLLPGEADVAFARDFVLPSTSVVFSPFDQITLRGSYNKTVARQTFKELTPILQQEFLGGPIFIGNPELQMSTLKNYDIRLDLTPIEGSLLSVSWFKKRIAQPIEYVQRLSTFDFTTAVNYPKGVLSGWEFEVRQDAGALWEPLEGLSVGGNATLIDAKVTLPKEEALPFLAPNIQAPVFERDMSFAPDHLYNLFVTWESDLTGTGLGVFYTAQGDTLVAGAAVSSPNFVPDVYAVGFDTLNFSLSQRLNDYISVQFRAKNLTDPEIREVYRSQYIGGDVTKTSFTKGVDYSLSIGSEVRF